MPDYVTVATLVLELGIQAGSVRSRAQQLGFTKPDGLDIWLFTPKQAKAIRQRKSKRDPTLKPESEITASAKSK